MLIPSARRPENILPFICDRALGAPKTIIGLVSALIFITVPMNLFSDRMASRGNRTVRVMLFFGGSGVVYLLLGVLAWR
jgi:hypothetical protein